MLKSLYIKNYALIDELFLEFNNGLNIITGETGAGKSIIVDAFITALGERASVNLIRNNQKKAIIEVIFDSNELIIDGYPDINNLLSEQNELIIRREININGNSRCFLNDTPVQLNSLKELGNRLVDFHGQHQHQLLLHSSYHMKALDSTIDFGDKLKVYQDTFKIYKNSIKELDLLKSKANELNIRTDHYSFELKEIEKINPQINEFEEIEDSLKKIENSETIFNLCNNLIQILSESESSIISNFSIATKLIENLKSYDSAFIDFYNESKTMQIALVEISRFVNNYMSNFKLDENTVNTLKERYLELNGLKKKYGNYSEIFNRIKFLQDELNSISNYDEKVNSLENEIEKMRLLLIDKAKEISEIRNKHSKIFSENIIEKLKYLGMEHSKFDIYFHKNKNNELNENGIDNIDFLISTNKGENLKQLKEVASGGEISRIMLAIKYIISEYQEMPILVFDEIDIGISGKIGQKTGLLMKELSKKHQILAITHLPQIAALGDINFNVQKITSDNGTVTKIEVLNKKEKINVIAQMLSGENITDSALENAEDLINSK